MDSHTRFRTIWIHTTKSEIDKHIQVSIYQNRHVYPMVNWLLFYFIITYIYIGLLYYDLVTYML
jgi:hypothetical protein